MMNRRDYRALAAMLVGLVIAVAPDALAASGERLRSFSTTVTAFETDRNRYALWIAGAFPQTRVVVLDTRTDTQRGVSIPEGCRSARASCRGTPRTTRGRLPTLSRRCVLAEATA